MLDPEAKKAFLAIQTAQQDATPGKWKLQFGGGQISREPAHVVVEVPERADWYIADFQDDLGPAGGDPVANAALVVALVNALPHINKLVEGAQ